MRSLELIEQKFTFDQAEKYTIECQAERILASAGSSDQSSRVLHLTLRDFGNGQRNQHVSAEVRLGASVFFRRKYCVDQEVQLLTQILVRHIIGQCFGQFERLVLKRPLFGEGPSRFRAAANQPTEMDILQRAERLHMMFGNHSISHKANVHSVTF